MRWSYAWLVLAILLTGLMPARLRAEKSSALTGIDSLLADVPVLASRSLKQVGADTVSAILVEVAESLLQAEEFVLYRKLLVHATRELSGGVNARQLLSGLRATIRVANVDRISPNLLANIRLSLSSLDIDFSDHRSAMRQLELIGQLPADSLSVSTNALSSYYRGYLSFFSDDHIGAARAFAQAASYYREAGNTLSVINSLDASASSYNELGRHKKAFGYAQSALEVYLAYRDTVPDATRNANLFLNLAEAEHPLGLQQDAYAHTQASLLISQEANDSLQLGLSYQTLGKLLVSDGRFLEAEQQLETSLAVLKAIGKVHSINHTQSLLVDLYYATGRYRAAFDLAERVHHVKDSLSSDQERVLLESLTANHDLATQRAELALLREQSKRNTVEASQQQLKLYALGGLIALLFTSGAFIYYRLTLRRRAQDAAEAEVERRTAELKAQTRKLEASNADLERFAYIASHDLKTPLRNVTSFLNLIERRLPAEAREHVQDYLSIATDNARQMHHLVTDVLEFSRIDANVSTQSERFSLGEHIQGLVTQMSPQLRSEEAEVTVTGEAQVVAPQAYVIQLVRNLVENGLKYNKSEHPSVRVSIRDFGSEVSIRVSDNGIGIDQAYYKQIFELFKRLHVTDRYEGTGLGLAVCKKILERLGGSIAVDSVVGEGSTFTIILPKDCTTDESLQRPGVARAATAN